MQPEDLISQLDDICPPPGGFYSVMTDREYAPQVRSKISPDFKYICNGYAMVVVIPAASDAA